jgi:hypothetical protein
MIGDATGIVFALMFLYFCFSLLLRFLEPTERVYDED